MSEIKNPTKSPDAVDELREELKDRLTECSTVWTRQYEQIEDDLKFASGCQWDEKVLSARAGRPSLTLNITRTYINRIVNPLRMAPFGIQIEGDEEDQATAILRDAIRDLEYRCNAAEAYEMAYEHAVTAGIGWITVDHDYISDDDLEQEIKIKSVPNPLMVWIDPASEEVDGSDAEYAFVLKYLDEDHASKLYKNAETPKTDFAGLDTMYSGWMVPDGKVADVMYYRVVTERQDKYWYQDGTSSFEVRELEPFVSTRKVERKRVERYRFVGTELVSESTLSIPWIPVVPVYGDRLHLDDLYWGGIVHLIRTPQTMINYYASSESELVALAPRAPWIVAEGQTEDYPEWDETSGVNHAKLTYKPTTLGEQMVPAPFRADNQAQTQGLQQSRIMAMQDVARTTGIFDNMFGAGEGLGAESGRAVLAKQSQGELATAQYLDNLSKSIRQVGRIVVEMMPVINDTERSIPVRDEDGQSSKVRADMPSLLAGRRFDVRAEAGPAYESRRKESLSAMLQLGQAMPDRLPLFADKLAEQMDFPEAKAIAERLYKTLPPELKDAEEGAIPAEAQQALDAAQQTIAELEATQSQLYGAIQQMQSLLIAQDADREAELAKTKLQEESDLEQTRIKAEADLAKEAMKQEGLDQRALAQIMADFRQEFQNLSERISKSLLTTNNRDEAAEVVIPTAEVDPYRFTPAPGPVYGEAPGAQAPTDELQ